MSPGRVHDPEGAKTLVISYTSTTGATTTVIKRRFQITCYTEPETRRLRVDPALTVGHTGGAHSGATRILIYDAHAHPLSDPDQANCGAGTTLRDRHNWVVNTLKNVRPAPGGGATGHRPTGQHTHWTQKWGKYYKIPQNTSA
jgi:hypothetical protein